MDIAKKLALVFSLLVASQSVFSIFTEVTSQAGMTHIGKTYGASWGDFNGDGYLDLWVGNHDDKPILYLNGGDGTFTDVVDNVSAFYLTETRDAHGAAWIDIDNDGDKDLVEVVGGTNPNNLFLNQAGALIESAGQYGIGFDGSRSRTVLGIDWNGDRTLDLLIPHELNSTQYPMLVTGEIGSYTNEQNLTGLAEINSTYALIADISEDGIVDIIIPSGSNDRIIDTSVTPFVDLAFQLNIPGYQNKVGCLDSVVADFNGDLRNDIFSICGGGGRELIQRSDFLVEAQLASVAEETAIEFNSPTAITLSVFPSFAFEIATHLEIGANDLLPPITHHPELGWLSFSVTIDPLDINFNGTPVYIPGVDLGLFIAFDSTIDAWRISLSAPVAGSLGIVINSSSVVQNLKAIGFPATPLGVPPKFLTRTDGGFIDATVASGLNFPAPCLSVVSGDFDNDGDVDIYMVCSRQIENLPNILLLNDGSGNFISASNGWGAAGSLAGSGDAVVTADYDNDGDLDIFLTNGQGGAPFNVGPHQLYRNDISGANWLEIDLDGVVSNRDAIGAIVTITTANGTQMRTSDGGFHRRSQDSTRIHFGLGLETLVNELEVRWPSGAVDILNNVSANQIVEIVEAGADSDGDGVSDIVDNCIDIPNASQANLDGDIYGDECDFDKDGDGITNVWELQYLLDPEDPTDAILDADSDGYSNLEEFGVGTDPNDPNSFLAIGHNIPMMSLYFLFSMGLLFLIIPMSSRRK